MKLVAETIEVDLPALAARFGRRLSDVGVPVTPERSVRFAEALTLVRPVSRRRLYWTARAALLSDPSQRPAFDRVFDEVFGSRSGERPTADVPPSDRPHAPRETADMPSPADLDSRGAIGSPTARIRFPLRCAARRSR